MFNHTTEVECQHSTCRTTYVKTRFSEKIPYWKKTKQIHSRRARIPLYTPTIQPVQIHVNALSPSQTKYTPQCEQNHKFLSFDQYERCHQKSLQGKKQVWVGVGNLHYIEEPIARGYCKGAQEDKYRTQAYR